MQRRLGFLALGDVFLDGDEVGDDALLVADRGNGGGFPIQRAILAPIVKFAVPFAAVGDGLPQLLVLLTRGLAGFENARVGADGLGLGIAGGFAEFRVDVLDGAVVIGDDHGVGALFERARILPQRLFRPPSFPDFRGQLLLLLERIPDQPGDPTEFGVLLA